MRFQKEHTLCRKCKHAFNYHALYVQVMHGGMHQPFVKPLEIVPCSGSDYGTGITCGCLEFEPIENLEYLEWKAELHEKTVDDTTW